MENFNRDHERWRTSMEIRADQGLVSATAWQAIAP